MRVAIERDAKRELREGESLLTIDASTLPSSPAPSSLYTKPLWLFGTGNYCEVTIAPEGLGGPVEAREASLVHELVHCAQAEAVNTEAEWNATPDWIAEGTAN